jgi:hypothetical protein
LGIDRHRFGKFYIKVDGKSGIERLSSLIRRAMSIQHARNKQSSCEYQHVSALMGSVHREDGMLGRHSLRMLSVTLCSAWTHYLGHWCSVIATECSFEAICATRLTYTCT